MEMAHSIYTLWNMAYDQSSWHIYDAGRIVNSVSGINSDAINDMDNNLSNKKDINRIDSGCDFHHKIFTNKNS